ncbi:MAG: SpoIID/LytB domain-containing protein [Candidatus Omnitrophica bacterium]|nr:SpoIID/LytB domain-containing protein [Candidatus Omnitrophota bacterium]
MLNFKHLNLLLAILLIFVQASFAVEAAADNGPLIRIAIAKDIDAVEIQMTGAYEILNPLTRESLESGMKFTPTVVTKGKSGLMLGNKQFAVNRIRFYCRRDVTVGVNNKERRYRGFVDVVVTPNNKLLVINQLEVEDYIKGVLYHEVSNRWPMEALKVQAVAARSYALYQIKASVTRDFDVTNDIYSQVYGGRNSERYRTNLAVDGTKGEVLMFQGKVLPAYFHATCGGHTENSKELWPRESLSPLEGIRCIYCRESPHYFWKRNLQLKEIQEKLNAKGLKIGLIDDIAVTQRNRSERILTLIITDKQGQQLTISGKDFREIVGPNIIRSNNYYVVMQGYYCDFFGKGWGHGVGMCQWGAQGMATQGYHYDKILQFYYPGSTIKVIKGSDSIRAY